MGQFPIKAICNDNNNPLFILGSTYTSNASGAEQMLKQIIYIKLYRVNNPNWPGGGGGGWGGLGGYLLAWPRI